MTSKYKLLEEEKNKLKDEIDKLNTELLSNQSDVQTLIELIKGKDTEIQNLNTTFQTDFDNLKSQHQQQFSNALEVYRAEIDRSKEQFRQEIEEVKNEIDIDTSDLITKLNTKHDEAKTLVNLIGNVGITGNYQNIANNHKQSADFWRWAAVIFMILFSGLLIWTIIDLSSESFNWAKSLIRLIAAAALSYPATYAARESSKHRKLETINRNAELELASINPFIEGLEDGEKQKIKAKLVENYFGNHNNFEASDIKDAEGLSMKALDKILDTISKIKG